jgi:hypothetical protein
MERTTAKDLIDSMVSEEIVPMDEQAVAQTFMKQFKGMLFMIGAKSFTSFESDYKTIPEIPMPKGHRGGIIFRVPRPAGTHVTVFLEGSDEYTIIFSTMRGMKFTFKKKFERVPLENIPMIFKQYTGMETTMPRVVGINSKDDGGGEKTFRGRPVHRI